ncbi:hypothetical protein [Leclercia adecarboxylata]|uniref:hypothetical protein n=1 Tax=Leclercia adecarboxylata TaxID=83655 RepID=UPI0021F13CD2|nr:hypothetical protein [Leclercia adecarboxylata]UYM55640.1 hypothetical protein N5937_23525 [Leclercia adecarboxylata]
MSDSLSNKELVAVGHQFAKTMSSDTPIIDMAKIVSSLAERLDCPTADLHATQSQRDRLGAENGLMCVCSPTLARTMRNMLIIMSRSTQACQWVTSWK